MSSLNDKIINDLVNNVYCRIARSKISGVGVIAVRDIPKGTNPFCGVRPIRFIPIDYDEIFKNPRIDPEVLKMVRDFYALKDRKILFPAVSLNEINISFFLNTSKKPNLKTTDGENFIAKRNIKKGEELNVDYDTLSDAWD